MRAKNPTLLAVLLIAQVACSSKGGTSAPPVDTADKAATGALATLQKLVTDANYKALGFDSVEQVKTATLAAPMPVFAIGLDRLKSYQPGQDASGLLAPNQEAIYPVSVDGQTKSSVTVMKKASGYVPASFGNAATVKALVQYRGKTDSFAVHIPVLSMYFLGNRIDNRLMLTPVMESSRLPLRVGVALPADEVIKAIVPLLQGYNGLPL